MQVETLVKYRDKNGRFAKRGQKELWEVVKSATGKILAINKRKSSSVYFIRSPNITDSPNEAEQGMLSSAFRRMNLRGDNLRDAKRIEVTIQGKDYKEKTKRFKLSLDVGQGTKPNRAQDYMIGAVLSKLRERGYRTAYSLEKATFQVRSLDTWDDGRIRRGSKANSKRMKELSGVSIIVKVIK